MHWEIFPLSQVWGGWAIAPTTPPIGSATDDVIDAKAVSRDINVRPVESITIADWSNII